MDNWRVYLVDNIIFDRHESEMTDPYGKLPVLSTDGLVPVDTNLPIKLSMIISFTNWRREQLARSLETIARQNFKEFEVLICDIGSTQDMKSVYEVFSPYIKMKTKRIERESWSSDPSRGIVEMLPDVSGDVIATMQPEMMLHPDCFDYLYGCHYGKFPETFSFTQSPDGYNEDNTYVNIRNYFLSTEITHALDLIDWHTDIRNIETHPNFFTHHECLSSQTNQWHWSHEPHKKWVWWFASSAKKSSKIWEDMPKNMTGHAAIDFYLIAYKRLMRYLEFAPQIPLAYHQEHARASISPSRDSWVSSADGISEYLKSIGRL